MADVDALNRTLGQLSDQYQYLFSLLNSESQQDVANIASSLSLAMAQLYQLAIFVRGDYDQRAFNESPEKDSLLAEVKGAFAKLAEAANTALDHLSKLQAQMVESVSTKMHEFEQNVKAAYRETTAKVDGYKNAEAEAMIAFRKQQIAVRQAQDNLLKLRQKYEESRLTGDVVDGGVSAIIPIWGLLGRIDHSLSPGSVILGNEISDARDEVDNATHTLISAQETAQATLDLLNREQFILGQQYGILERLGPLGSAIQSAITKTADLEQVLIRMKENATGMVRRMNNLSGKADTGAKLSITKKEFVECILDVVELAIVEPNTARQVETILAELRNEWGPSPMPPAILSHLDELDGNAARIAG